MNSAELINELREGIRNNTISDDLRSRIQEFILNYNEIDVDVEESLNQRNEELRVEIELALKKTEQMKLLVNELINLDY